jgi:hypothetical protein
MPLTVAGAVLVLPAFFWLLDWLKWRSGTPLKAHLALALCCLSCAGVGDAWLRRSGLGLLSEGLLVLYFAYLWFSGQARASSGKGGKGQPKENP